MTAMTMVRKLKPHLKPLPAGTDFKNIHVLIATWFGAGRIRPAPGTMGSLAAIPPGMAIAYFFGMTGLAIAIVVLFVIGCSAATYYGDKSGQKDDQSIVVDEVVGIWIAALPAQSDLVLWIAAFILFRFFDIYKPWPASYFDKDTSGGFDVMMDDAIAGVFAFVGIASTAFTVLF